MTGLLCLAVFARLFHTAEGVSCYQCTGVTDPSQCTTMVTCLSDQTCFAEKKLDNSLNQVYNFGCEATVVCDALGNGGTIVGRKRNLRPQPVINRQTREVTVCNQCCNTDNCNRDICANTGTGTTAVPATSDIYIRLLGGSDPYRGILQVYFNDQWGMICDDDWDIYDAMVACRMVGYKTTGAGAISGGSHTGSIRYWLSNVDCTGTESSLYDCPHGPWGLSTCSQGGDAGVVCSSVTPEDDIIFILDAGAGGRLYRMNLLTLSYVPIPLNSQYGPLSFDYDPSLGRIYFVDPNLHQIISVNFDGKDARNIMQLDLNSDLDKIEVDPLNRLLFYTDAGNDVIAMMNLDGSSYQQVITSNLDQPREIVLDPRSRTMFWSDWGKLPKIESANYDGSNRRTLVNTNIIWPNGLAIDYDENMLYFVDGGTGTIEAITLQGNNRREILKSAGSHLFAIDIFGDYLYYTDWNRNALMRVNKDGTGNTPVGPPSFNELSDVRIHKYGSDLPGVTTPSPVHFDPSHVFVKLAGSGFANEGRVEIYANSQWGSICDDHWDQLDANVVCGMIGFDRTNSVATSQSQEGAGTGLISLDEVHCLGTEEHIVECGVGIDNWSQHDCSHAEDAGVICSANAAPDNFIVIADAVTGQLNRMDLTTYSFTTLPLSSSPNIVAVTYDPNDQRFYFSEVLTSPGSEIRSSDVLGKDVRSLGTIAGSIIDGLAVDRARNILFYSDAGNKVIRSMAPDGTGAQTVATNVDQPRAIALDKVAGVVYWTDWGATPKIEKANYDGTNRQTLASSQLYYPNGLAVDVTAGLVYFCDSATHRIEVMNTDGSSRRILYEDYGAHFFGLTLTSQYIYYSDWARPNELMRLDRDGSNVMTAGPPSFGKINGIYAYESAYT